MTRRAVVVLMLSLVGAFLIGGGSARASCSGETRTPSPYAFTGVVVATSLSNRVAQVVTDDGRAVVVRGTSLNVDNGMTTVDRSYTVRGRYEFDVDRPDVVAGVTTYNDNICSATKLLATVAALPATLRTESPSRLPLAVTAAAAAIVSIAGFVAFRRRRRNVSR